jgi:hypothetical protein
MMLDGIKCSVTKDGKIIGYGRNRKLQEALNTLKQKGIDYRTKLTPVSEISRSKKAPKTVQKNVSVRGRRGSLKAELQKAILALEAVANKMD